MVAPVLALSLSACHKALPEPDYSGITSLAHTVQHTTGSAAAQQSVVRLYPNPFVSFFKVELSAPDPTTAVIYLSDEKGKYRKEFDVEVTGQTQVTIDFNSMPKGVYLCEVHMAGQVSRYRTIKTN